MSKDELWNDYAQEVEDFYFTHHRAPRMTKKERYLAAWLENQRHAAETGSLTAQQLERLTELNDLIGGALTESDRSKLAALRFFVKKYGCLPTPEQDDGCLYNWVRGVMLAHYSSGIPFALRSILTRLGVDLTSGKVWESKSERLWNKNLADYIAFCDEHGRLPRPSGDELSLYQWAYRNTAKLEKSGIACSIRQYKKICARGQKKESGSARRAERWMESRNELGAFIEQHHRLPNENDGHGLWSWLKRQEEKASDGTLEEWKMKSLEEIGLTWKLIDVTLSYSHRGQAGEDRV